MKRATFGIMLIGIAIALSVGIGFAQKKASGENGGHPPFGPGGPPPFPIEMIADKIGMTDVQKAGAKEILDDSKNRIEPIMEALRLNHKQIMSLGTDGIYNESAVTQFASKQAELTRNMIIETEKTKASLFALLTEEQRQKAEAIRSEFEAKKAEHGGRGFGPPPEPEF
jgi:Spy/CpxP family protein refolding chaperone